MKGIRFSLLPAAIALAAFFAVLPRDGADATIKLSLLQGVHRFSPFELTISPGERVAFEKDTSATHTATCLDCLPEKTWSTGDIQPGDTKFMTFSEAVSYAYACNYHGQTQQMTGRLTVGTVSVPSPLPT